MDFLKRDLAPLSGEAWKEIDNRAKAVLATHLSARRVVNVQGPYGWDFSVLPEGRLEMLDSAENAVKSGLHKVKPLVETRISFKLNRWEMDNLLRGAKDINLDALDDAVEKIAMFEEDAVYNGYDKAGIIGLVKSAEKKAVPFGKDDHEIMQSLSAAVLSMKDAYQDAPFSLVVGEKGWKLVNSEVQGYPLMKRIQNILGGSVYFSSAVQDALLIPHNSEDVELTLGGDFSIGYEYHDAKTVQLFIAESFTFRVLDPAIIVPFLV